MQENRKSNLLSQPPRSASSSRLLISVILPCGEDTVIFGRVRDGSRFLSTDFLLAPVIHFLRHRAWNTSKLDTKYLIKGSVKPVLECNWKDETQILAAFMRSIIRICSDLITQLSVIIPLERIHAMSCYNLTECKKNFIDSFF